MKERWPWLAVLAAAVLTGFFLPDLSLAVQDGRAEGRTESRAVDSPVVVHEEEKEDVSYVLDDMELVSGGGNYYMELTRGRELDYDTAMQAALSFLESMAAHSLIPNEMTRDVEIGVSPRLLCSEDARTAVVWNIELRRENLAGEFFLDDRGGRLLAFNLEIYFSDNMALSSDESALLERMLSYCQENCAPLTCESSAERADEADWAIEVDDEEYMTRTAFHLSDETGRTIEADVFVNRVMEGYYACSFNS